MTPAMISNQDGRCSDTGFGLAAGGVTKWVTTGDDCAGRRWTFMDQNHARPPRSPSLWLDQIRQEVIMIDRRSKLQPYRQVSIVCVTGPSAAPSASGVPFGAFASRGSGCMGAILGARRHGHVRTQTTARGRRPMSATVKNSQHEPIQTCGHNLRIRNSASASGT